MESVDDWLAPKRPAADHPAAAAISMTEVWLCGLPPTTIEPPEAIRWPPVSGLIARASSSAEAVAAQFIAALAQRTPLSDLLDDRIWIAQPSGGLASVDRDMLLLAQCPVLVEAPLRRISSYDLPLLRVVLPGGVAHALAARLPIAEGKLVCGDVRSGPVEFRCSLMVRHDGDAWRIQSLPLAPIDSAWRASVRALVDERSAVRLAHRVVQAVAMGQSGVLAGLRNLMRAVIHTPKGLVTAETWIRTVGSRAPYYDRLDRVIGPTRPGEAPDNGEQIIAAVEAHSRRPRRKLRPLWTQTEVGRLVENQIVDRLPWRSLVVEDPSREEGGARLAALVPPASGAT